MHAKSVLLFALVAIACCYADDEEKVVDKRDIRLYTYPSIHRPPFYYPIRTPAYRQYYGYYAPQYYYRSLANPTSEFRGQWYYDFYNYLLGLLNEYKPGQEEQKPSSE